MIGLKQIFWLGIFVLFMSCGNQKKVNTRPPKKAIPVGVIAVNHAKSYLGTPYQYGGSSFQGIDCSGLIYQAFLRSKVRVPRTVKELKKTGRSISIKKVRPGDILFFRTSRKRKVTHAGLVVRTSKQPPEFIHSSTSRGVIVSSLSQGYWNKAFVEARRIAW